MKSKYYWILLLSGGLDIAILNCFTALVSDIIAPYGYNQNDAGTIGLASIAAGLVFAGLVGYYVDKTKNHELVLKICSFVSVVGCVLTYFSLCPDQLLLLSLSNAVLGMGLFAVIPISMVLVYVVDLTFCV